MNSNLGHTNFILSTIIQGRVIHGHVTFSPPLEAGIMTELARFEAERLLSHAVAEDIATGKL